MTRPPPLHMQWDRELRTKALINWQSYLIATAQDTDLPSEQEKQAYVVAYLTGAASCCARISEEDVRRIASQALSETEPMWGM